MDPSNLHIHTTQGPQAADNSSTKNPVSKKEGPPQNIQQTSKNSKTAEPASISQTNTPSGAKAAALTNISTQPQLPGQSIDRLKQFAQTLKTGDLLSFTQDGKKYIVAKYPDGILIQRQDDYNARQRSGLFVNTSTNSVTLSGNNKEIMGVINQCCPQKTPSAPKPKFTITDQLKLGLKVFMGSDESRKQLEKAFREIEKAASEDTQGAKGLKKLFGSKQAETIEGKDVSKKQSEIITQLMSGCQLSDCVGPKAGGRVIALYDPINLGTKAQEVPAKDFERVTEAYKQLIELQPVMRNMHEDWDGIGHIAYGDFAQAVGNLGFNGDATKLADFLENVVKASREVLQKHWPEKYMNHVGKE